MATPKEKNKNLVIILAAVAIVAVVVIAMTAGGDSSNQIVTEEVPATDTMTNAESDNSMTGSDTDTSAETPAGNAVDAVEGGLNDAGNAIDNTAGAVANEVGSAPGNPNPAEGQESGSEVPTGAPTSNTAQ